MVETDAMLCCETDAGGAFGGVDELVTAWRGAAEASSMARDGAGGLRCARSEAGLSAAEV